MNYLEAYIIILIYLTEVVYSKILDLEEESRVYFYLPLSVSRTLKFRRSDPKNLPPCNEDQLMIYLAEIQAINPESIINLATFEDIHPLCSKVSQNLNRMNEYLKTCEPSQQKDLYIQLMKGVDSLHHKLCVKGDFQKKFEHDYKCFHNLHNDFQDCAGPPDWTEDSDDFKICKAYKRISDCYYVKTAKLCGNDAANVIKELIVAIVNSVLVIDCKNVKQNPVVNDAMPDATMTAAKEAEKSVATINCNFCNFSMFYVYLLFIFFNTNIFTVN